jgi:hypothetical protein
MFGTLFINQWHKQIPLYWSVGESMGSAIEAISSTFSYSIVFGKKHKAL